MIKKKSKEIHLQMIYQKKDGTRFPFTFYADEKHDWANMFLCSTHIRVFMNETKIAPTPQNKYMTFSQSSFFVQQQESSSVSLQAKRGRKLFSFSASRMQIDSNNKEKPTLFRH